MLAVDATFPAGGPTRCREQMDSPRDDRYGATGITACDSAQTRDDIDILQPLSLCSVVGDPPCHFQAKNSTAFSLRSLCAAHGARQRRVQRLPMRVCSKPAIRPPVWSSLCRASRFSASMLVVTKHCGPTRCVCTRSLARRSIRRPRGRWACEGRSRWSTARTR